MVFLVWPMNPLVPFKAAPPLPLLCSVSVIFPSFSLCLSLSLFLTKHLLSVCIWKIDDGFVCMLFSVTVHCARVCALEYGVCMCVWIPYVASVAAAYCCCCCNVGLFIFFFTTNPKKVFLSNNRPAAQFSTPTQYDSAFLSVLLDVCYCFWSGWIECVCTT